MHLQMADVVDRVTSVIRKQLRNYTTTDVGEMLEKMSHSHLVKTFGRLDLNQRNTRSTDRNC